MKTPVIYHSNWALLMALLIIIGIVGCTSGGPVSTPVPESSPVPDSTSMPVSASPSPISVEITPTSDPNVLYQDNFTNKASGWQNDETFDNYFIGYHEPEYYHVEFTNPNFHTVVPVPDKHTYQDVTIELQVLTNSKKTSASGDFRYGLAFRRSGDQYYAFTISSRTKKWFVFKSSASGPVLLQEGQDDSIHKEDEDDLLRVDAQGSNFFFHINDHLVGQPVTDSDYAEGEIGFYVESFDISNTHIHFDQLIIRDLALVYSCSVPAGTVYVRVRTGPSQKYAQIGLLSGGATVQAKGITSNQWIQIVVEGSNEPGWVSYKFEGGELSCIPTIDVFPLVSP